MLDKETKEMPIVPVHEMEKLVGTVLETVEATQIELNEAFWGLLKRSMWSWYNRLPGYTTLFENASTNLNVRDVRFIANEVHLNEQDEPVVKTIPAA